VSEGAQVVITGRRQAELDAAAAEIGPRATGIRTDVGKMSHLDALFEQIKGKFGRFDVLSASRGAWRPDASRLRDVPGEGHHYARAT